MQRKNNKECDKERKGGKEGCNHDDYAAGAGGQYQECTSWDWTGVNPGGKPRRCCNEDCKSYYNVVIDLRVCKPAYICKTCAKEATKDDKSCENDETQIWVLCPTCFDEKSGSRFGKGNRRKSGNWKSKSIEIL